MKNSNKIQEAHFKNENTTQYRFKNYTTIAFLHDVEKLELLIKNSGVDVSYNESLA